MPARHPFAVAVAALAAAAALFLAGCSTTIGGSGRVASSPADASSPVASSPVASAPVASAPESPSPQPPSSVTGTTPRSEPNSPTPVIPTVSVPLTVAPSSAPGGPSTSSAEPSSSSDLSPTTTTVTVTASPGQTSGGPTTSGTTTNADPFAGSTPVDPDSFKGTVTPIGFASPSGNITCGFQATRNPMVVCQIDHHSYTATGGECHGAGSWGDTITVAVGLPATFLCAGDVESGGPTLAYGKRIDVSGLSCVSRENGVTCKDTAGGAGFRLASGSYDLF